MPLPHRFAFAELFPLQDMRAYKGRTVYLGLESLPAKMKVLPETF